MNALTRPAGWAVVALAAFALGHGRAEDLPKKAPAPAAKPAEPPKEPTVMQRKLAHAQKVLEGLATEDYGKIGKNADGLLDCVKDATWKIAQTDRYVLYSDDFRRGVEGMRKAAKDKKIDAAALAYVDITLTCVKCHRYLRDEGIALAPELTRPARGAGD